MTDLNETVLVTGGCGFIGSAVIRDLIRSDDCDVVNVDALTYAANPHNLESIAASTRYHFEHNEHKI